MNKLGRPRKLTKGVNQNWSHYLMKLGAEALKNNPASKRAIEFRHYLNRISRQANKQLAELKRNNMTHYGYEQVQAFTRANYKTTRFKLINNKSNLTVNQMYAQGMMVQRFLNFATSTVEGYQNQLNIRRQKMRQLIEKGGEEIEDKDLDAMLYLLSDSAIRGLISNIHHERGVSETIIQAIAGAYRESTVDEIKQIFADYQEARNKIGISQPNYKSEYFIHALENLPKKSTYVDAVRDALVELAHARH